MERIRLAKFVKNYANLTRSELQKFYDNGLILVNNEIKGLSYLVSDDDIVQVDGKIIDKCDFVYYAYNKPKGYVCTNDITNSKSFLKNINIDRRVFAVGRLDKDTSGLLILTNDGKFFERLLNPEKHIEKEYVVVVKDVITDEFLNKVSESILMDGKMTKPAKCLKISDFVFKIIITEGKYHQIKRLVMYGGNLVVDLERIRIGKLKLENINIGDYKEIRKEDVLGDEEEFKE